MTNYMELLAANQPWNLILFMVIPMGTAELLVATEFFTLFYQGKGHTAWRAWNHWVSLFLGIYFIGVFLYLAAAVVPGIVWRGGIDLIAVGTYLLGVVPLAALALMELGVLDKGVDERTRARHHAVWLIIFLVLGHIAMIFGMADPRLSGWQPAQGPAMQMDHSGHTMK